MTSKIVAFPMLSTRIESSCRHVGRFFISTSFWPFLSWILMRLRTCNGFLDYCDRRKQTHSYLCSVCLKDCNGVNTIFFCVVFHQIACYRISYHTLAQESSSQMGDANEERVVYTNRSSILLKSSHTVDPVERPASIIVFGFTIKDNIMYPGM